MIKELQDFGLSENEAKVYYASLEIGKATADQLSKQSGVKRPTTYLQVESLITKGLMSTYEEGKKTYFAPESPDHLKRIFEKKKQEFELKEKELHTLLPGLSQMFAGAGERPVVRFFEGKEGIVTLREETLNTKSKELCVVSSNDDLRKVFSYEEMDSFSERRATKNISMRLLYTKSDGKIDSVKPDRTERAYIKASKLSLATDIVIFDNFVGFMTLRGKLFGVLIQSEEIKKSMHSIFEALWMEAEKH